MRLTRILLSALLLLACAPALAQQQADTLLVGRSEGADSTVLVVPYRELVEQRLDALVDDTLMETTQLGLMVWDLTDDTLLYERWPRHLLRPASTMKLLTAITALDRLGGGHRFTTSLYYKGTLSGGTLNGDLVCVGGMDPLFAKTDMQVLVQALKDAGVKSFRGRIVADCSMKDGDKWGEGWCWDDKNPTLTPLLYEGKAGFCDQLLRQLKAARLVATGVTVTTGTLPADAQLVATRSHSLDEVLQQMMKESDNLFAESTYFQVAASTGSRPAQASDARSVERELLARLGLDADRYRLADGSGLSLYNYVTAEVLVRLLRHAWQTPGLYDHLLPSLPIAGVDGTLKNRMKDTAAEGNVQAKTGTVTGVSALAGYCTAPNGHRLCFAIINQGVRHASDGRAWQDRACQALCQP